MPRRETAPLGSPCWVDLMTSDMTRSREFYGRLFGWTADDPDEEFGGYVNFHKDGVPVAGCMSRPPEAEPDTWSVYLASDDAAGTLAAATAGGAQVLLPAMQVGDLGTMAVLTDVGGARIGLWQPDTFPGFGVLGEPGTPSWFELHTRAYATTLDFYRSCLSWTTETVSDTGGFDYSTLKVGDDWLAGVMDASSLLAPEASARWSVYFGTEDTDAALAAVVELGGSVVLPAQDTPYGRLAAAADPTGAQFKLVAANQAMPAG